MVKTNNVEPKAHKKVPKLFIALKMFFKNLKTLTAMQFKDQIDFGFLKSKKKTIAKIVYSVLFFIIITFVIQLILNLVVKFGLFSFLQTLNFRVYLVLMTILFLLSFISCLVRVTNTLYFSKDNTVLITMPVKNNMIFTSKLIVSFIYELLKNITYILPFFFAYGMVMSLPATFYLWAIFSLVFFTLLSVVLSGLLSIPAMTIAIVLKKHKVLEYIVVSTIIVLAVLGLVKMIAAIPQNIDLVRDWGKIYWKLQDFLKVFAEKLFILDYLLQMFTGLAYNVYIFNPFNATNFKTLQICLGIIIISLTLIYLLSKPLFLKMISSPFEYKKSHKIRNKKNFKTPVFISSIIQQSKRIFRTPNLIYSVLAVATITPIAVFLQNKIIGAMDTRMFGNYMGITFNILIILLLTLSSNTTIASIYSREGNSAYLNKVNPVNYHVLLSAKVVLNASINVLSIIISCGIINTFASLGALNTIILTIAMVLIYIAHLFWSAELDIMNPQNQHYQTTGSHNKNPNELKSTIIAFFATFIFTFATFTFIQEEFSSVFPKLLLISTIFFIFRTYLYFTRIKLYYKEK